MSSNFVVVIITVLMIVCIDAIFTMYLKHAPKNINNHGRFFVSIFLVFFIYNSDT